jgi:hypothetical protein
MEHLVRVLAHVADARATVHRPRLEAEYLRPACSSRFGNTSNSNQPLGLPPFAPSELCRSSRNEDQGAHRLDSAVVAALLR